MRIATLVSALVLGFVAVGCSGGAQDEPASTPVPEGQGTGALKGGPEQSGPAEGQATPLRSR